jgi:hypothetical protein
VPLKIPFTEGVVITLSKFKIDPMFESKNNEAANAPGLILHHYKITLQESELKTQCNYSVLIGRFFPSSAK